MKYFTGEIGKYLLFSTLPVLLLFNFLAYILLEAQFRKDVSYFASSRMRLLEYAIKKEMPLLSGDRELIKILNKLDFDKANLKIYNSDDSLIFNWNRYVNAGNSLFDLLNRKEIYSLKKGMIAADNEPSGRTLFSYFSVTEFSGKNFLLVLNFYSADYENNVRILFRLIAGFDILLLLSFGVFLVLSKKSLQKQIAYLSGLFLNKLSVKDVELSDEFRSLYYYFELNTKDLKHVVEKAENRVRKFDSLINNLSEGVAVFNDNFQLEFCNRAFKNILSRNSEEFKIGDEIFNFIEFPPLLLDLEKFRRLKAPITNVSKYYGDKFLIYTILPPENIAEENGEFIIVVKDITELKRLETIRKDFVANVSHEFKTPLTTIRGYAEVLLNNEFKNEKLFKKFAGKIFRQTYRLETLVNNLIDLNKIESKTYGEFDLIETNKIIADISDEFKTIAENKGLTLEATLNLPPNVKIKGEENLINVILTNLLMNAIQYSRKSGKITFTARKQKDVLILEIKDNGIGIAEDEVKRIFERFYRTKRALAVFKEGSGLGLSLVKNAVELLGGKISVESKLNNGSLFRVELPVVE